MTNSKPRLNKKYLLFTVLIVIFFALLGVIFAGDGYETFYADLVKPTFEIPLAASLVVQALYYIIMGVIVYRLMVKLPKHMLTFGYSLFLMFLAEAWNYLLFGLESTSFAFLGMLGFSVASVMFFAMLLKVDRKSAWIFLPYLIWLLYNISWSYALMDLNMISSST